MRLELIIGHAAKDSDQKTNNKGGRPPTTGYRTNEAIKQRSADRELLSDMKRVEDIS